MAYDSANPKHTALARRVAFRMDEVSAAGQVSPSDPAQIYAELEEAARAVLLQAPRQLVLAAAEDVAGTATIDASDAAMLRVELPEGYLRFIRVRLDTWRAAADVLHATDGPAYRIERQPYGGSTKTRPAAYLVPLASAPAKQALECYPAGASVDELYVVTVQAPEDVPADLEDALIWRAAGRVLQATQDDSGASAAAYGAASDALSNAIL